MRSPRYAPAGFLATHRAARVAFDGGPGAEPVGHLDAWLGDERSELQPALRSRYLAAFSPIAYGTTAAPSGSQTPDWRREVTTRGDR
jgi:hypothetical protein